MNHSKFNMKKSLLAMLVVLLLLVFTKESFAQTNVRTITGKVVDETQQPIPGVTVTLKESTSITVTNSTGNYSIKVSGNKPVLLFSYNGMKQEEIAVGVSNVVDVLLKDDVRGLESIVIIGYGTQKEKDLTGAVASIKGEAITKRNEMQLSNALQGITPGVSVTRSNGVPGSTGTIRVRGITTIGNSNPLILVDGIAVENIDMVNPSDVESISVLKDAASASIYGSRASAGVILVTTKRAKTGSLSLTYDGNTGITTPTQFPGTVGYERYMEMINEVAWNDGGNLAGANYGIYAKDFIESYGANNKLDPDRFPITNWNEELINKNAISTRHGLSLTYGSEVIKSKASFNYESSDALYNNKSFDRITARINNDIKINQYLSTEISGSFVHSLSKSPNVNPISAAYRYGPLWRPYWSDGTVSDGRNGANVWGSLNYGGFNNDWEDQILGKLAIHFTPVKNFKITGVIAPSVQLGKGKQFIKQVPFYGLGNPSDVLGNIDGNLTTSLKESRSELRTMTKQVLLNYNAELGNKHSFSALAGYEDYYRFTENMGGFSDNFQLADFPYLDRAPLDFMSNSGNASENAYNSYFGRIIYSYADKYLLQANIRFDGSSRFHKDYRWANFPSISVGWVATEESFVKNLNLKNLSFLKIRGSWGTLGNERIGNYPYQSIMNFSNALFVENGRVVSRTSAAQQSYNITDISWETTETWNLGVDAKLFSNRFSITADVFQKNTRDMLLDLEIPDFIGYNNPSQNAGLMKTTGWDLQLGWNDQIGKLGYSVGFNMSDYRSVMGNLSGIVFDGNQIIRQGSEFNEWYGYASDGLFKSQADIDSSPLLSRTVKPGDVKYKDISGPAGVPDGKISPEYDRVLLGGSLPRMLYGANIDLNYKGFDASLVFQGVGKKTSRLSPEMVYQVAAWQTFPDFVDNNYFSQYKTEEQNAKAKYPRLSQIGYDGNNYKMSDFWLIKGSYFRVKNVTLGYTLPKDWTNTIKMSRVRVYASGTDLFSSNSFPKGWDPEAGAAAYIAKTWNFGVQVQF